MRVLILMLLSIAAPIYGLPILHIAMGYNDTPQPMEAGFPLFDSQNSYGRNREITTTLRVESGVPQLSPFRTKPAPSVAVLLSIESKAVYERLLELLESKRPFHDFNDAAIHRFPEPPPNRVTQGELEIPANPFLLIPRLAITLSL